MPSNHSKYTLPSKGVGNAGVVYGLDPTTDTIVHPIQVDSTGALIVSSTAGAGASASKAVQVSYYIASVDDSNGSDYVAGDLLKAIDVIDTSTGTVDSTTWINVSNNPGTMIGTPPGSEITLRASEGLTDAELRAAPVEVQQQSTERQFSTTRLSYASGTINAGALEVAIAVESGYATIQGTYMPAGYSMTIRAEMQDTVGAITIDATNGSVIIMEVI